MTLSHPRLQPEHIDELVSFLPLLAGDTTRLMPRIEGLQPLPDGSITMPSAVYPEETRRLFDLAAKPWFMQPHYSPSDVEQVIADRGRIAGMSLEELRAVITYCVRGERFVDGHWGAMIDQGHVAAAIRRLAELRPDLPRDARRGARTASQIRRQQRRWAQANEIEVDPAGYCIAPESNLFPVSERTRLAVRRAFEDADGGEFAGTRAKASALHSSSALGVNVFGYWLDHERTALAAGLGLARPIQDIAFEWRLPTGVSSRPANIDLRIDTADGAVLAVENKFTESFGRRASRPMSDRYFTKQRWAEQGLYGAQRAAHALQDGDVYEFLDAAQLLKHMLALGLGLRGQPWRLLLLWYVPDELGAAMRAESHRFAESLGVDAERFVAMSYQDLWRGIEENAGREHADYVRWVGSRYFPSPAW